jgi:uncharacterized protein DUF3365
VIRLYLSAKEHGVKVQTTGSRTGCARHLNHYFLRSLWPINPKNAPKTDTEKTGLQYVLDLPGTNYYGGKSLGARRYFTAVYAEVAIVNACADCHNRNPDSPKKDFKTVDVSRVNPVMLDEKA